MVSLRTLRADLSKLRGLSRKDRGLLLRSALFLPIVHVALRLIGYSGLRRLIESSTPLISGDGPASGRESIARGSEIAGMISIAARRGVYQATCLRRSMLLWWFLRREGIASTIRFGVRKSGGVLEAHAWVEYNGTVINDAANIHEHYPTLQEELPATRLGL